METFRQMVNNCIMIGLENNVSTRIKLTKLCYRELAKYDIYSVYKICAISHAAGILANRNTSVKRGLKPRQPYAIRPLITAYIGFKIINGILKVPLGDRQYYDIPLNDYVKKILTDHALKVRSIILTANNTVGICISKEVPEIEYTDVDGMDRNLGNVSVGNIEGVIQYDLSRAIDITENTHSIVRSFKRNDRRIRKKLYLKYGNRRKNRISQLLHHTSKSIVRTAKTKRSAIAFEDIRHIRRLYQLGNGQSRNYRSKMNDWSFAEIKRQIEYKAKWEGVHVIQLTKGETRGTSQLCPQCGKKITQAYRRQLYCAECKRWMDRDVVAAMNLSIKGLARFASSKGLAGEAMKRNLTTTAILRVDANKLGLRQSHIDRIVDSTEPSTLI